MLYTLPTWMKAAIRNGQNHQLYEFERKFISKTLYWKSTFRWLQDRLQCFFYMPFSERQSAAKAQKKGSGDNVMGWVDRIKYILWKSHILISNNGVAESWLFLVCPKYAFHHRKSIYSKFTSSNHFNAGERRTLLTCKTGKNVAYGPKLLRKLLE